MTDHPFGPGVHLAEVRNNYTDPYTKTGPLVTYLRTLGIDGEGAAALPAVPGYDDATGVGSPAFYIESFKSFVYWQHDDERPRPAHSRSASLLGGSARRLSRMASTSACTA